VTQDGFDIIYVHVWDINICFEIAMTSLNIPPKKKQKKKIKFLAIRPWLILIHSRTHSFLCARQHAVNAERDVVMTDLSV